MGHHSHLWCEDEQRRAENGAMVIGEIMIQANEPGQLCASLRLSDGLHYQIWMGLDEADLRSLGDTFERLAADCREKAQRLRVLKTDRASGV